jgi:hypothetical protein
MKVFWATRWGGFIALYLASLVTFAVAVAVLHRVVALVF